MQWLAGVELCRKGKEPPCALGVEVEAKAVCLVRESNCKDRVAAEATAERRVAQGPLRCLNVVAGKKLTGKWGAGDDQHQHQAQRHEPRTQLALK